MTIAAVALSTALTSAAYSSNKAADAMPEIMAFCDHYKYSAAAGSPVEKLCADPKSYVNLDDVLGAIVKDLQSNDKLTPEVRASMAGFAMPIAKKSDGGAHNTDFAGELEKLMK